MDKRAQMMHMTRDLDLACAAADWQRLSELANALAPQLLAWSAAGALSGAERQALTRLRASHERAAAACATILDQLDVQLTALRDNKDGWLAYALSSDTEAA